MAVISSEAFGHWLEFLQNQAKTPGSHITTWEDKHPDTIHGCCTMSASDLKLLLSVSGEGAMMLYPVDENGSIRLLHHFFVRPVEESDGSQKLHLIAINGARAIAEFANIPDEAIRGKLVKRIKTMMVPSIEDFLGCEESENFVGLRGGDDAPDAANFFKGWHNSYPLPSVFIHHAGQTSFSAAELAFSVIQDCHEMSTEGIECDDHGVPKIAIDHYKLMAWLWAVEQGLFTYAHVTEVPDDGLIEARCREIRSLLDRTSQRDNEIRYNAVVLPPAPQNPTGNPPPGQSPFHGDNDALMRDVLHSLAKVQEQNSKRDVKEQSRKMMTHRLTEEDAGLYRYLSARDFYDKHPQINRFTDGLLSDKDPTKALNLFRGVISRENWDCIPSKNCLIQFFAQGFLGQDFDHAPTGITLFMFRPTGKVHAANKDDLKMGIRHLFGSNILDEETVKTFAKTDLYLPTCLDDLLKQIVCMIRLLDLITGTNSIASCGYREALEQLRSHGKKLVGQSKQASLWVRIGFFVDQVFQNFATEMANIIREHDGSRRILRAARAMLEGSMERDIRSLLNTCRYGVLPNLVLPTAWEMTEHKLDSEPLNQEHLHSTRRVQIYPDESQKNDRDRNAHAKTGDPNWWSRNADPIPHWRLPKGKKLTEVFDIQDTKLHPWTKGWPMVPHHISGKPAFVCQRYQVLSNCRKKCRWSHISPSQLAREDYEAIDEKIKLAYNSI